MAQRQQGTQAWERLWNKSQAVRWSMLIGCGRTAWLGMEPLRLETILRGAITMYALMSAAPMVRANVSARFPSARTSDSMGRICTRSSTYLSKSQTRSRQITPDPHAIPWTIISCPKQYWMHPRITSRGYLGLHWRQVGRGQEAGWEQDQWWIGEQLFIGYGLRALLRCWYCNYSTNGESFILFFEHLTLSFLANRWVSMASGLLYSMEISSPCMVKV